mmetsp:Transcript_9569/g.16192  ORF Transcript_9569/g.16192 Transcript_9569/m.16192 type:complete len:313 (+) Transcript_9569:33-971(+)
MARNQEKANSMLNRWYAMKNPQILGNSMKRRPRFVAKCSSLKECEQWRMQVIKEIQKQIAVIQNPTLNEDRVRHLNDEINKLIREKGAWERHIKTLGGADYARASSRIMNDGGILGSGGYRYFGAAKNLPGVRELLEERERQTTPAGPMKGVDGREMKDVYAACDALYFGYDDLFNPLADQRAVTDSETNNKSNINATDEEKDKELAESEATTPAANRLKYLAQERIAERRLRSEAIEKWRANKRKRQSETADFELNDNDDDENEVDTLGDASGIVPTQADIEAALLERRKEQLLKQYVNKSVRDELLANQK